MGPGEFLNINFFTALFTLVNTLVLFLVLKKFLFKPVMKMITERQQEIDAMYDDAGAARAQAKQLQASYEDRLADAQKTGDRIVKEATARAQAREDDIIRQANAQADAIRQKAEQDIAREKKKAINDAKDEIAGLAMEIAGKVVGHSLNQKDQSELVEQFIEQLGDGV